MPTLPKHIATRPIRPQGDTMYRAATVIAALMFLATVASIF